MRPLVGVICEEGEPGLWTWSNMEVSRLSHGPCLRWEWLCGSGPQGYPAALHAFQVSDHKACSATSHRVFFQGVLCLSVFRAISQENRTRPRPSVSFGVLPVRPLNTSSCFPGEQPSRGPASAHPSHGRLKTTQDNSRQVSALGTEAQAFQEVVLVNDLCLGCCVSWQVLAEGRETTVRDRKAGSQQLEFPRGQPGQFPRAGSVSGVLDFQPPPRRERLHTQLPTRSFPGDQPGLFSSGRVFLGRGRAPRFPAPTHQTGYTPSSLSLFSLFYKYLLSTSLPPRPPGSSPVTGPQAENRVRSSQASAPALAGKKPGGRHTANRK